MVRENDKVRSKLNPEEMGVVKFLFADIECPVAVVRLEGGDLKKIRVDDLELFPEEKNSNVVTISRELFKEKARIIVKRKSDNPIFALTGIAFMVELEREIFGDREC